MSSPHPCFRCLSDDTRTMSQIITFPGLGLGLLLGSIWFLDAEHVASSPLMTFEWSPAPTPAVLHMHLCVCVQICEHFVETGPSSAGPAGSAQRGRSERRHGDLPRNLPHHCCSGGKSGKVRGSLSKKDFYFISFFAPCVLNNNYTAKGKRAASSGHIKPTCKELELLQWLKINMKWIVWLCILKRLASCDRLQGPCELMLQDVPADQLYCDITFFFFLLPHPPLPPPPSCTGLCWSRWTTGRASWL